MQHAVHGVAEVLRLEIEGASRPSLPEVGQRLWSAVADGTITEADAEVLGALLARRTAPSSGRKTADNLPFERPRPARPRPTESIQRRRRWAAAGFLPPQLACQFTLGEQAVLGVVAVEIGKRGTCSLTIGHIAAVAGVSESTVRRALRQARVLGLVKVQERRVARFRNETNIITIISAAWCAWLSLSSKRRPPACQNGKGTNTKALEGVRQRDTRSAFWLGEKVERNRRGSP